MHILLFVRLISTRQTCPACSLLPCHSQDLRPSARSPPDSAYQGVKALEAKELQFSTAHLIERTVPQQFLLFHPGFWHVLRGLVDGTEPEATSALPLTLVPTASIVGGSDAH